MHKNIAAFTSVGNSYPEYISINEQPTGNVTIHVRAAPIDGAEGNHAYIELWPEQWAEVKRQIREFDGDRLRTAATNLYFAGKWSCHRPADEARLWEELRDALDLEPGAATSAGVHN